MGDLTENLSRKEFACKCGCGYDRINLGIVHRVQLVRDIVRIGIKINSACRCQKHNTDEGGKPESLHLPQPDGTTWAIDFGFYDDENSLLEKLCTKLIDNWSGGFHFYPQRILPDGIVQPPFCHCDIGRRRRW
jgi:hypothetical protein